MSISADMGDLAEAIAGEKVAKVKTWLPGEVVQYDAARRLAYVKAKVRPIVIGDDGESKERTLPNAWMPVPLFESGGFVFGADVEVGDRGRIHYSQAALEEWMKDGQERGVRVGEFKESDAYFAPGGWDNGRPGVEIARGQMIIGAADGPRIIFDRTTQTLTLACVNEIRILAGALVRTESRGDVVHQKRRVSPLGGEI